MKWMVFDYSGGSEEPDYLWIGGERYAIVSRPTAQYRGMVGSFPEFEMKMTLVQFPLPAPPPPRKRRTVQSLGLRRPQ